MNFTIIATSDVHGQAERFSQLTQQIATEQPDILLDLGDFLQGSALSYYYEEINKQPHPLLQMANALHYDAAIFGNHEFNYALEGIAKMRAACNFPWLACNVGDFATPYLIKNVNGIRVAVIGVVTHAVPRWDEWYSTSTIAFSDAYIAARDTVQFVRMQEKPDFVILCYHGGFERDPQTGQAFCVDDGENQGYRMLHSIDGVNVLLTGHQHLQLAMNVNGVSVVQPGAHAQCYAKIKVNYENGQFTQHEELVAVDETLPKQTFDDFTDWANTVVATRQEPCTYEHFLAPRLQSHPLTTLVHHMQQAVTNAPISVVELPYHMTGGFQTQITNADILYNLPRKNYVKVIRLNGAEIKQALELCAAVFAINSSGDIDFSSTVYYPEPQPYIYDVWGGIDYELTISKPVGQRVTKLLYQGRTMHVHDEFEVTVSSYRATGAHGFAMMHKQAVREVRVDLPRLMTAYLQQPSTLPASHFRVIKEGARR